MAGIWLLTPPGEAVDLAYLLEDGGHEPTPLPEEPPHAGLRAAAEQVHRFRWLAGSSPRAVRRLLEAVSHSRTRAGLSTARWLVCDARSLAALERRGLSAQQCERAELGATLGAVAEAGDEVLVVLDGEAELPGRSGVLSAGASLTEVVLPGAPELPRPPAPVAVVHSVIAAERLADWAGSAGLAGCRVVATGAAVAQALEAMGVPVHGVAQSPEPWAVAEAVLGALPGP